MTEKEIRKQVHDYIVEATLSDDEFIKDDTLLFEEGIFGTAIAFPTVPQGKARIRVMISAAHSQSDLDEALGAFKKVGRELGVIS
jgi:7-keto-8-aminopelargonate synthetase-like enzyme